MKTFLPLSFRVLVISTILALFSEVFIMGQDVILKKNGDEIKVKVEQVLNNEIKYRKFENLSGPVYSLTKAEIIMIRYENGTSVFIEQAVPDLPKQEVSPPSKVDQNKSLTAKRKNPSSAFLWSLLFPGGGQIYNHQYAKGFVMGGIGITCLVGMIVSPYIYGEYYDSYYGYYYEEWTGGTLLTVSLVVYSATYIWSMIDAPLSAKAINRKNGLSLNYKLNKNIDLAVKPDYKIDFIGGKAFPVMGAKISFNIH